MKVNEWRTKTVDVSEKMSSLFGAIFLSDSFCFAFFGRPFCVSKGTTKQQALCTGSGGKGAATATAKGQP